MTPEFSVLPRRRPFESLFVDYSLYLVTGRELLPPGVDYYEHLDQTLRGGKVTVVQIREKHVDNGEFLDIAQRSLAICDKVSTCATQWGTL
jgi:thiamine-phosphate diphosphorylase/hydroxyethylthiazole kinase